MKKVGIVILNYNKAGYSIACAQSILAHETYANFEIAVVDNNSPSATERELIRTGLPAGVHLIMNPANTGYAAGNNAGARFLVNERAVDYVLVLNNDSVFNSPVLGELVKCMEADPDAGAASPIIVEDGATDYLKTTTNQVRRLLPSLQLLASKTSLFNQAPFSKKLIAKYLYKDLRPFEKKVYTVDTMHGAAFMVPAALLKEINFLDEGTFLYHEEFILGFQIKKLGKHCLFNTNVAIMHFQGVSTNYKAGAFPYQMFKYEMQSVWHFYRKYYHTSPLVLVPYMGYRHVEYVLKNIYLWMTQK